MPRVWDAKADFSACQRNEEVRKNEVTLLDHVTF